MSEEILKALTQLFAIITKQDEGASSVEKEFVLSFFKQRLAAENVKEYIKLYEEFLQDSTRKNRPERPRTADRGERPERAARPVRADRPARPDRPDRPSKAKLTSVKDSVRTLSICKKINKTLTQKQKVIVLVELLELVNSDKKFTPQRREILNTVSNVFNIEKEEHEEIEKFVLEEDVKELDLANIFIAADSDPENNNSLFYHSENLDKQLFILKVKSVDLYFIKYNGKDEIILNNQILSHHLYLYSNGSTIKPAKDAPIYYSDVVAQFNRDKNLKDVSFNVKGLEFKFPNGHVGLRDVNITETQGKLLGIMGASGAGKTTLLNVLAGLEKPSTGEVLINGINIHTDKSKVEGVIGYISQDDILIEDLTVFENLYFNAKLCFKDTPRKELVEMVNKTLQSLGLDHIKGLKVGSVLNKKISGGQRKRLNIALELIREPAVMFVDEPTSGLSSRDSENVIDLLKELSLRGKLIFVVIHQPSSEIYKKFDKMFIMDTGGYPIYYGNPVDAITYFRTAANQINSEKGMCSECGNVNPEQMFDIVEERVVNEYGQETSKRKVNPLEWHDFYKNAFQVEHINDVQEEPPKALRIPNMPKQWLIYTIRDIKSKISNKQYLFINLLEAPFLAFLLAFIIRYNNVNENTEYVFAKNENIPAYLLMSIVVSLFMGLTVSAEEIIKDRKILKREKFLNLSRGSYLFSKLGILFTLSALQTFCYVLVGNTILEIHDMLFQHWLILFSCSCFANILGLNISSAFNSAVTVYIVIPLLLIPQMILSGALFNFNKLNDVLANKEKVPIIADVMASRWAYEAMAVEMYKNNGYTNKFYKYEKYKQQADFYRTFLVPKLDQKLKNCEGVDYATANDSIKEYYMHEFTLLKNELVHLNKRTKKNPAPINENFSPESLNKEKAVEIRNWLNNRKEFYDGIFLKYSTKVDGNTAKLLKLGYNIQDLRNEHLNESLEEIVRNLTAKNRVIEHKGQIIQLVDPIYKDPEPRGALDYRTHFYAPTKHFAGMYFDTFTFNVAIIWMMTLLLYITLYFDLLKKLLEISGRINFVRKKEH